MDSIFPGLGGNIFSTKPLVDYFNTGRKTDSGNAQAPAAAYPDAGERSDADRNKTAVPGRGTRIDYLA